MKENIRAVSNNFEAIVYDDGISQEEAKIIAQNKLIEENLVKFYDLSNPKVAMDVTDLPNYEEYWFITFKEKKAANIKFTFMAIIDRKTGKVKFANDYQEDKKWILEAVLLNR